MAQASSKKKKSNSASVKKTGRAVKTKSTKATTVTSKRKTTKSAKSVKSAPTKKKAQPKVTKKTVPTKAVKVKKEPKKVTKTVKVAPKVKSEKERPTVKTAVQNNVKNTKQTPAAAKTTNKVSKISGNNSKPKHFLSPTKEMLQLFKVAAREKKKLLQAKTRKINTPNFLSKPDRKWKEYNMDLRIHSPAMDSYFFSSSEDSCTALVRLAKAKGLDVITVTDLYNMNYLEALKKRAAIEGIRIIPGFEFTCKLGFCDDLQFLALFPEEFSSPQINLVLNSLGVASNLAARINLRINLPIEKIIQVIEDNEGILIPTHIDKTPIRQETAKVLIDMFGFHAFDLLYADDVQFFKQIWPAGEFTFFNFSNSNSLAQIGNRNSSLRMPKEGFDGLKNIVQRRVGSGVM
jgi:glycerophosphoryl diester phosphodiesterase